MLVKGATGVNVSDRQYWEVDTGLGNKPLAEPILTQISAAVCHH